MVSRFIVFESLNSDSDLIMARRRHMYAVIVNWDRCIFFGGGIAVMIT